MLTKDGEGRGGEVVKIGSLGLADEKYYILEV